MRLLRLRGRAADAAIAIGTAIVVLAGTLPQLSDQLRPARVLLGAGLLAVACGALYLRRRYPVSVAAVTLLVCFVYYPFAEPDGPIVVTFVVALYTTSMSGNLAAAVGLGVAAMTMLVIGELRSRHIDNTALLLFTGWLVAVIAIGGVSRNRQAYLREAERRAAEAEHTREEEALRRATEERLRIARELHDVLGHHLSLINVQASAALHRLPKNPAGAPDALTTIKQTSKDALRELRATLGVLRQVDEVAPTAPALAQLTELAGQASALGLSVRTEIVGEARPLPAEVDLAAYRIVQEALTNVSRHAGTSKAVVRVRYGDDDVLVEIDDDGKGAGGGEGHGIRGMGERARALGGTLSCGDRPEGGFRVRAQLPLGGGR